MKITFVLHDIRLGGGNRAVLEISNRLIERGHDVSIVYPFIPLDSYRNRLKKVAFDFAGNLRRMNRIRWFRSKAKLIPIPTFHPRISRLVSSFIPQADCIVATAWQTANGVAALPRSKGKKFYFVQHYEVWPLWNSDRCWELAIKSGLADASFAFPTMSPTDPELRRYKQIVDQTYKLPLEILTTSRWLATILAQGIGVQPKHLVGIGNNFEIFSRRDVPHTDSLRILAPYRRSRWKGDTEVIKALSIIKRRYPQVDIVLFGARIPEEFPFEVKYQGVPSDDELCQLYSSADIFLCGSWIEGWGSPPMEAMACGAAVVTTAVGGIPEFSENLKTALHVAPRSVDQLVEAISYLIENPERRVEIAQAGEARIREFSWERTVDLFEASLIDQEHKLVGNL